MAFRTIPLTRGYVALVDEEDYHCLAFFKWYAHVDVIRTTGNTVVYAIRSGACRNGKPSAIRMHQEILGCTSKVDHRDGDGLNNQRANLRPANNSQNGANRRKAAGTTSSFKGVRLNRSTKKWQARITVGGKTINLGHFRDEVDAATAYNFAAHEVFGEFARFNMPLHDDATLALIAADKAAHPGT